MENLKLSADDIEYIADMLQAVAWAKEDLLPVSPETQQDLTTSLALAQAALRRAVSELRVQSR